MLKSRFFVGNTWALTRRVMSGRQLRFHPISSFAPPLPQRPRGSLALSSRAVGCGRSSSGRSAAGVPFEGHQARFSGYFAASVPFEGHLAHSAALSDVRHFFSTNDVVMREALQTRRMAPCHAMGLREGVLRDGYAPQASPARGAPQHRLTNNLRRICLSVFGG